MGKKRLEWFARTRQRACDLVESREVARWCSSNAVDRDFSDEDDNEDILEICLVLTARNVVNGLLDTDYVLSSRGVEDPRFFVDTQ